MGSSDLITELDRLHHRARDMRARERQLADAGENDPASDAWKIAAILAASAESEFEIAMVEAWPALARLLRDADQWRARESETQEALQAIGVEFGVRGGEPRVDGIRRVLTEQRDQIASLLREAGEGWRPIATLRWVRERNSGNALAARPGFGRAYYVVPLDGGFIISGRPSTIYRTEALAQEAAQAIHEAHIRSALLPAPPATGGKDD